MKGGCAKDIQSSLLCSKDEFVHINVKTFFSKHKFLPI